MKRIILLAALAVFSIAAAAQVTPGGGTGRTHGGGNRTSIIPDAPPRRPGELALQPHPIALFAAALDKEVPALGLSQQAASATQEFMRDMKDYAALDDKRARLRVGLAQSAAHATVDVARDFDATRESTHELDGAAADVASGWKKVAALLDETQRRRVEAIYANALLEARRGPAAR